ncbi:terminase large subunit [Spirosoma aerophilum]
MNYADELLLLETEHLTRQLASIDFKEFVPYVNRRYDMQWFHEVMADHLQAFAEGSIKKLMITMPPQHGKSELSTRSLPCYLFGQNPDLKIALLSYSADKARKFSREVQQRLSSELYQNIFPGVRLATGKDQAAVRTQAEFDIVGHIGSLKAVGRRGPLTGDPVDIVILDDLFKDNIEAQNPHIREQTWADWIIPVVESRLHNNSQMLYVTTRWHEDDPSGRFLDRDGYFSETNPDGWVLLNFPALKTANIDSYDQREEGEALWPGKHSKHRMELIKKNNPTTFDALYQGDPKPSQESIIFGDWIEVDEYPEYVDHEFYGIDFGYSNDPSAATRIGRVGQSLYLDEQFYETGLTNQDMLKWFYALGMNPSIESICDKAEPKSIEELKRGYYDKATETQYNGINAKGCDKGPGSIAAGISKLKEYTVYVTKRSRNLIKEKNNYTWIMSGGKATNVPIGTWNHAIDGVRSAVFTVYGKPQPTGGTTTKAPGKRSSLNI